MCECMFQLCIVFGHSLVCTLCTIIHSTMSIAIVDIVWTLNTLVNMFLWLHMLQLQLDIHVMEVLGSVIGLFPSKALVFVVRIVFAHFHKYPLWLVEIVDTLTLCTTSPKIGVSGVCAL